MGPTRSGRQRASRSGGSTGGYRGTRTCIVGPGCPARSGERHRWTWTNSCTSWRGSCTAPDTTGGGRRRTRLRRDRRPGHGRPVPRRQRGPGPQEPILTVRSLIGVRCVHRSTRAGATPMLRQPGRRSRPHRAHRHRTSGAGREGGSGSMPDDEDMLARQRDADGAGRASTPAPTRR